jgi:succinate-semialdehyde dehydrogenase/glutarate-semialdehyde dehydrogenase
VCANRIFVQSGIHDQFVAALAKEMKNQLIVGDGAKQETTIGPMINSKAVDKVKEHLDDALAKGGKLEYGGKHLGGNFFMPSIITNVNTKMMCSEEETFGPLAPIFK